MMQAEDDRRCWSALSSAAAAEAAAAAQPPTASLPPEVSAALRLGQPGARLARLPQLARRLAAVLERAGAGPPAFDPASLPGAPLRCQNLTAPVHTLIRRWCHSMAMVRPSCLIVLLLHKSAGGCWYLAAGLHSALLPAARLLLLLHESAGGCWCWPPAYIVPYFLLRVDNL